MFDNPIPWMVLFWVLVCALVFVVKRRRYNAARAEASGGATADAPVEPYSLVAAVPANGGAQSAPQSVPSAPVCLGCGLPKSLRYTEPRVVETRDDPAPGWMDSIADSQGYRPKGHRHSIVTVNGAPCLCDTCFPLARSFCEGLIASILSDRTAAAGAEALRVSDYSAFGLRSALSTATAEQRKQRQIVGKGTA